MLNNSFEGVEKFENYIDIQALNSYRKEALDEFKPMSNFIGKF